MTTPAVTDWIPGDQKPTIVGVYERQSERNARVAFSKWNGRKWCCSAYFWSDANKYRHSSFDQNIPWRGLASDPKGTK